ncbi:hypothetical protein CTAM01_08303 [Colletotrichum tamarilloi]|uniref:Amino acid permease/ SLC12A domain-containing protein n=1 Tax=Colletotrichum tamarilloi TaxID=1209934 RepID=A0ABQ9R6V5_9PEZI|nr:uncharacterized protein CTAM01_08303 [Colletotrichum tamarilloi]KAK1496665.1 hypothetical protein CTAM01_08303 [Colletotrichum tamarilloi]
MRPPSPPDSARVGGTPTDGSVSPLPTAEDPANSALVEGTEEVDVHITVRSEPAKTMITINGTLGTGLYGRTGQILELGGPVAVILSFFLVGSLAWAVMQCITELLCIWPIPGALSVYVAEFVDNELGIAVGVAYWFTYSVGFAALIASSASYINFWSVNIKGFLVGVVYVTVPIMLKYGMLEVITGGIKITFLFTIIVISIAIHAKTGISSEAKKGWETPQAHDELAAKDWGTALMMSTSIAAFAYVGVEIVAASALEAHWSKPRRQRLREKDKLQRRPSYHEQVQNSIANTLKFTAVWVTVLVTVAYVVSGLLVTLGFERDNCELTRLSWVHNACKDQDSGKNKERKSSSPFVLMAQRSGIYGLDHAVNAALVFTAITCANTNLYVASRTLFGITSSLDGGYDQRIVVRCLAWLGQTNKSQVPMRAMVVSALAFCWVPFLQEGGGFNTDTKIGKFIEILAQMGSVGVAIVWACQSFAFIRFYRCIQRHQKAIEARKIPLVQRWNKGPGDDYPYRSHGQPLLGYIALAGCMVILGVSNGAALWTKFHWFPFLSSYLIVIVFILLWVALKLFRNARWKLADLSSEDKAIKVIENLHQLRARTL